MIARVFAAGLQGIDGYPVTVEVDIRPGLPSISIVGLPDVAVRESRERVVAAIRNSGYSIPPQRITINLAPAHIKKEGPSFDFSIAIGILSVLNNVPSTYLNNSAFLGELSLGGELHPIRGVLPCTMGLKKSSLKNIFLPYQNANEASLVDKIDIYPIKNLAEAVAFLKGDIQISTHLTDRETLFHKTSSYSIDFSEVKGQEFPKRAMEIAAAGGHNILLIGPPGSGKTLLARRLATIMPDLDFQEALEVTKIHSVAGFLQNGDSFIATRPFRSPHHQISPIALIGGGAHLKPGEVSLAHRGVLFLDEFPEFGRYVLESLRQPLEDRVVTIVRVAGSVSYPSDFLLVAAANPCPCGYQGSSLKACVCSPTQIAKYIAKISGPLLDRIDLHVEVNTLKVEEMMDEFQNEETSENIRQRVGKARDIQKSRFKDTGLNENAQMNGRLIKEFCRINHESKELLKKAVKALGLSGRAFDRILKVSRTIADLEGISEIESSHISEAISLRVLDRTTFRQEEKSYPLLTERDREPNFISSV